MHVVGIRSPVNGHLTADPSVADGPPRALGPDEPLQPLIALIGSFYELEDVFK